MSLEDDLAQLQKTKRVYDNLENLPVRFLSKTDEVQFTFENEVLSLSLDTVSLRESIASQLKTLLLRQTSAIRQQMLDIDRNVGAS